MKTQDYKIAQETYQKNLQLINQFDLPNHLKSGLLARTYHQLGIVAQAQREYDQARLYYQQALQIKVQFNDRFSQASTYSQLGLLEETLQNYPEAQSNLLKALEIFHEFQNTHTAASILGISAADLKKLIDQLSL